MAASLITACLSFHLSSPLPSASHVQTTPLASRSRPIVALVDTELLSGITTTIADASTALPPEFQDAFSTAKSSHSGHPFSHYLMLSIGTYIVIDGIKLVAVRLKAKITGEAPKVDVENYLRHAPTSSFGWHHLDSRQGPLPPLDALHEACEGHHIGIRDGKTVYLCTPEAAVKYREVELSLEFTEHYDTKVYICYA